MLPVGFYCGFVLHARLNDHTGKRKRLYRLVRLSARVQLPQSKAFVHSGLWGSDASLTMDKTLRNITKWQ